MTRSVVLLAVAATVAAVVVILCVRALSEDDDFGAALQVSVRTEVIEAGAPVSVQATAVRAAERGLLAHAVRVTWRGQEPARLDDARFTHHVSAGNGHLVTAGRGCGADWDAAASRVSHICTADLQIVDLRPGESHDYPVSVYPEVGPLRLRPGTYVLEQGIAWWRAGDAGGGPGGRPEGRFTIRLTYEVR